MTFGIFKHLINYNLWKAILVIKLRTVLLYCAPQQILISAVTSKQKKNSNFQDFFSETYYDPSDSVRVSWIQLRRKPFCVDSKTPVRADRVHCFNRQRERAWNKKRVHPRKPEATITRWENPTQKAPKESKRMSCRAQSLAEMKRAKCLVSRIKRSEISKQWSMWLGAVCEDPVKDLFASELVYLYQHEACPLNAHLRLFTRCVP